MCTLGVMNSHAKPIAPSHYKSKCLIMFLVIKPNKVKLCFKMGIGFGDTMHDQNVNTKGKHKKLINLHPLETSANRIVYALDSHRYVLPKNMLYVGNQ